MKQGQSSHHSKEAGRRVLLIGRERASGEATERYLEYCGHEVELADSASSAVSKAEALQPQVVICDLNLVAEEDRVRAARRIQRRHRSAIVIITNYTRMEIRRRFPELNAVDCLTKPVSLQRLARTVSQTG